MHSYEVSRPSVEIFHRFVERFSEFVNPEEALCYWNALHTPVAISELDQLQFGVTELSISLQPKSDVSIRWLGETLRRQPFNLATRAQARNIAHLIFSELRRFYGSDYPQEIFNKLFNLAYAEGSLSNPQSTFRIGYALEFRQAQAPCFKWYAEPRTAGPDPTLERVQTITDYLSLGHHWRIADNIIRKNIPNVSLRGIGIDLSTQKISNLKVYYSTRECDWLQLQEVLRPDTKNYDSAPLKQFHRLILKDRKRVPPNTILLGVVLAPFLNPKTPIFKWDVFLPQLHTRDWLLQERIVQLCMELELDPAAYLYLWEVVVGSQRSKQLVNVHQYASIDLSLDGKPKLNVYLRAPKQITEHMPLAMRPILLHGPGEEGRIVVSVQKGLVNLADANEKGYSEMVHRMVFPREAGFSNSGTCCFGSVFQHAIVCRTLAMAKSIFDVNEQAIQAGLSYLLEQQDPASGGWKYFTNLPELPPDADDVAQVLLAFIETGNSRTTEIFSRILKIIEVLADPVSGEISTWLVDPTASDPKSQLYRRAIEQWWSDGSDPEVIANIAFALWRLDSYRFGKWILRACDWLASQQMEEGWWESTWYWGRTYGTWMAIRLFTAVSPRDLSLARATEWWISSQSKNGYWDPSVPSILETAFGLEVGVELAKAGFLSPDCSLLRRIASWLCNRQVDDGGWDASTFIRMDINRASAQYGVTKPKYRSYSSRIITTAFCIQALLDFLSLTGFRPRS